MARSYYPGDLIVQAGAGSPAAVLLAPGANFTVWSAQTGGTQYTDLKASDSVTTLPTSGSPAKPFADANGNLPSFWGPDGVNITVWIDTGVTRYPALPNLEVDSFITNGARKNVANTFTTQQTFNGAATAFLNTPTVAGAQLVHSGNLVSLLSDSAFIAALRIAVRNDQSPFGHMAWNNSTSKWMGWDQTSGASGAWVDDKARPNVPPGCCFYFAALYVGATLPTGTQAMQYVANGPGDKIWLHKDSTLWP